MDDSGDEHTAADDETTTDNACPQTGARSKDVPEKEKSRKTGHEEDDRKDSAFECNICLDVASDAVISMCGHLFCWPCLHQWLETRYVGSEQRKFNFI